MFQFDEALTRSDLVVHQSRVRIRIDWATELRFVIECLRDLMIAQFLVNFARLEQYALARLQIGSHPSQFLEYCCQFKRLTIFSKILPQFQ